MDNQTQPQEKTPLFPSIQPSQAPVKKPKNNKSLVIGGVLAFVAVVAIVVTLGIQGSWFQGYVPHKTQRYTQLSGKIPADYYNMIRDATNEIFMDSSYTGNDSDGSRAKPYKTFNEISNGPALANIDHLLIYMKSGTYPYENIDGIQNFYIDTGTNPFSIKPSNLMIIGGWNSTFTTWNPSTSRTVIEFTKNDQTLFDINRKNFILIGTELDGGDLVPVKYINIANTDSVLIEYNKFLYSSLASTLPANTNNILTIKNINAGKKIDILYNDFRNINSNSNNLFKIYENINGKVNFEKNFLFSLFVETASASLFRLKGDINVINNYFVQIGNNAQNPNNKIISGSSDVKILHNTFLNNETDTAVIWTENDRANTSFINNLLIDSPLNSPNAATIEKKNGTNEPRPTLVFEDFLCNPAFPHINGTVALDLTLGATSDCKNRGYSGNEVTSITTDYFGNTRPSGGGYDPGASEYAEVTLLCGNGVNNMEECDDGNNNPNDGCSAACLKETGWNCTGWPSTCTPICGDSLIKGVETCDPPGNGCGTNCQKETGWDCSPGSCDPICGDGLIKGTEQCDDDNSSSGDGCSMLCRTENGWTCNGEPSVCQKCGNSIREGTEQCDGGANCTATCTTITPPASICGNGLLETGETCDDNNTSGGDGCSSNCLSVETGFSCTAIPQQRSICAGICGDGMIKGAEQCDDDDLSSGDGCSSTCQRETGYSCSGTPSVCSLSTTPAECGDGLVEGNEDCDDDNKRSGDGCSSICKEETGWECDDEPSVCNTICGDGNIKGDEECDDDNTRKNDGCDQNCNIETGWECEDEPSDCNEKAPQVACECGDWRDVDEDNPHLPTWIWLCEHGGIVQGFQEDCTMRPDALLPRDQLVKIAFTASAFRNIYDLDENAKNCYSDVRSKEWYVVPICTGDKYFLKGYPDGTFKPGQIVNGAEAAKIIMEALDRGSTEDPTKWYRNYLIKLIKNDWSPWALDWEKETNIDWFANRQIPRWEAFNMLYRVMNLEEKFQ